MHSAGIGDAAMTISDPLYASLEEAYDECERVYGIGRYD
jgi:hypothetical protein